jgi:UDP-glucose 4-epimerase
MRILITGGAGFIGSHLVDRLLANGHTVLVVDDLSTGRRENLPPGAELAELDIASPKLFEITRRFRPDAVSHVAAQPSVVISMAEPARDAQTNILGGLNVFKAAIDAGCSQVVYITTGGALYGQPVYSPSDEEHPIRPISPYGLSKWTLECYARIVLPSPIVLKVLRLANVYGPRQDPNGEAGVVSIFGSRMLRGEPVTIFGDGEQTRDFVYVGDVAGAHEKALAASEPLTVNVSSGGPTSVNELFAAMADATDYGRPAVYAVERPGEIKHVVLDNRRAIRSLGWAPEVALAAGLKSTLDWLRDGAS